MPASITATSTNHCPQRAVAAAVLSIGVLVTYRFPERGAARYLPSTGRTVKGGGGLMRTRIKTHEIRRAQQVTGAERDFSVRIEEMPAAYADPPPISAFYTGPSIHG